MSIGVARPSRRRGRRGTSTQDAPVDAVPAPRVYMRGDLERSLALVDQGRAFRELILRSNSFSMDFLQGETTPRGVPFWAQDWSVGGDTAEYAETRLFGQWSLARSTFFSLRLDGDEEWVNYYLNSLADELSVRGQWIHRDPDATTAKKRFAPSQRSYTGTVLRDALINAGYDKTQCKLWIYSCGAKMDLQDFLNRATGAASGHDEDIGDDAAVAVLEGQMVIDVGVDYETASPVVVSPVMSELRMHPFIRGKLSLLPMWGKLGRGQGGFMMNGLQAPYSLLKVYNKHVSFWRSEAGFKLGMEAVFKKAPHSWVHGKFQRCCRTGLRCLDLGTALHWTRIEIRRSLDTRLTDQSWVDEITSTIERVTSAITAAEIPRRDIFDQAEEAFGFAESVGLFCGGAHDEAVTEEYLKAVVTPAEHRDANRLAYRLGWVYCKDVKDIYDDDVSDAPWGTAGQDGGAFQTHPEFRLSDTLLRTAALDPTACTAAEFTVEAHRLAAHEIDWLHVAQGNAELAAEMRRVGCLLHWSRYHRGIYTRFRFLFADGKPGTCWDYLEDAVFAMIRDQYDLDGLRHYRSAGVPQRDGVIVVA